MPVLYDRVYSPFVLFILLLYELLLWLPAHAHAIPVFSDLSCGITFWFLLMKLLNSKLKYLAFIQY